MIIEELFVQVDDFCQQFIPAWQKLLISHGVKHRRRESRLSMSEMMTIIILFQYSRYRDFKAFYLQHVCTHLSAEFPQRLSYSRFVKLMPSVLIPLCAYLQSLKSDSKGIAFIDSTPIAVCHSKRISQHKVFAGLAGLGRSTKGFFLGFKLHLICNHLGEMVDCRITPGNTDDRKPVPDMTKLLLGKLFGDKGYLSQALFDELFARGLQLVTGIRSNMKNKLIPLFDKLLLKKRAVIESVNNQLKNVFQLEHTRHRSPWNGFINILAALIAYVHYPNKPALNLTSYEHLLLLNP